MAANRPRGRQRNVTGSGKQINRRGSGLGTGPVGSSGGYSGRPSNRVSGTHSNLGGGSEHFGSNVTRSGGGMSKIIILILVALLGGGGGIGSLLLGGGSSAPTTNPAPQTSTNSQTQTMNNKFPLYSLYQDSSRKITG